MKGLRRYLVGSAIVMVGYLLAQYYKPKPTDWKSTYFKEDKIPYGTYILYQELKSIFPNSVISPSRLPVYNTLKDAKLSNSNYLLVAAEVRMDEYDYQELVKYMEEGNNVFVAAFKLSDFLADTLGLTMNSVSNFVNKKSTRINFVNPALKHSEGYTFNNGMGNQYFSRVDTTRASALGRNEAGDVNFVKYSYGKGALYLLPSPQLLSNYNMLNPAGAEYVSKLLSALPRARKIIWDENNTKGNADDASVLRVLFRNDQLRWAYYLAITGLLLFVLFEMKRRQRIIPVIEPLKNTSADFVTVVGKVYYQRRDNRDLARKKISYFLAYLRNNYRLKTTRLDTDFLNELMLKSGFGAENAGELISVINKLKDAPVVNDAELIYLNKLIEKFYKQAQ